MTTDDIETVLAATTRVFKIRRASLGTLVVAITRGNELHPAPAEVKVNFVPEGEDFFPDENNPMPVWAVQELARLVDEEA